MNYALEFNGGFCFLISIILFVIFYFISFKKYTFKTLILVSLFWIYITNVINICFFPIAANYAGVLSNIQLLEGYGNLVNLNLSINYFDEYDGMQQILNVLMLLPFGVLVPAIWKKNSLINNFIICFIFPSFIELFQFIFTNLLHISIHFTDVNDLFNNILGSLIGLFIYYALISKLEILISNILSANRSIN